MNIREAINNIEIIKYVGHVVVMKHMFHNVWQVIITLEPASNVTSNQTERNQTESLWSPKANSFLRATVNP